MPLRLALCQMNATVGDIAGNAARIRAGIDAACAAEAQLVLFPELALTGYPPEDLLLREHFLSDVGAALQDLAEHTRASPIVAVVGFPERAAEVYNAAAVLREGAVASVYRKVHLPNYGVFDEQRYFKSGHEGSTIELAGQLLGLSVCEDLWVPGPPAAQEAAAGASLILNISASPYHAGKGAERERLFAQRAREHGVAIAFCGMVGGQDELVFDGHSFVLDRTGATIARARQFEEALLICELPTAPSGQAAAAMQPAAAVRPPGETPPSNAPRPPLAPVEAEVYAALTLGLRDYVEKNGFERVVLGLSGGIDSALVACLAVDALEAARVSLVVMPSPYSSAQTQGDARTLAASLGANLRELPIEAAMEAYERTLAQEFAGAPRVAGQADATEENLQARIRGNLLMALSNRYGWLVLTTGNKSEMSVGYTTLYGDLAGGFAVIKDVPKTLVYRLCRWRNSPAGAPGRVLAPIPASIVERAPSAELRRDQRDEDSLPPYELLDRILQGYIEFDQSREQLIAQGLPWIDV
ncbi:MAG TPA: NAD+ synthase, partial [Solirubrobacteraceae bacterium]